MLLFLFGCSVERPPDTWPAGGCVFSGLTDSNIDRWRGAVEMDDGTSLQVSVWEPSDCGGAVVMVPGGLQPGISTVDDDQVEALVRSGLTVVAFDPRGRGDSGGEEDANGSQSQDDLAALTRWTAQRQRVDPNAVVIFSRSFGAAMTAGALARHDDLRLLAWVDYEGPGWLEDDLQYAEGNGPSALQNFAASVEDTTSWWDEREPAGFMSGVTAPYWRLQGLPDHALGARISHAEACVNGAVSAPVVTFNRFQLTLPTTEEQLAGWAIDGGLEPEESYVTQTLLQVFE